MTKVCMLDALLGKGLLAMLWTREGNAQKCVAVVPQIHAYSPGTPLWVKGAVQAHDRAVKPAISGIFFRCSCPAYRSCSCLKMRKGFIMQARLSLRAMQWTVQVVWYSILSTQHMHLLHASANNLCCTDS